MFYSIKSLSEGDFGVKTIKKKYIYDLNCNSKDTSNSKDVSNSAGTSGTARMSGI